MKEIKEKKDGKFKKMLKSKVGVGIVCFILGAAATSDTSQVDNLKGEIEQSEQSIETISKESETHIATIESKDLEIKELQTKIDDASPWFDMTEEEREVEKERIVQAKAQKEEDERIAKEQQAQEEENQRIAQEQQAHKDEATAIENNNNSTSNNDSNSYSNQDIDKAIVTQVSTDNSASVFITPTGKKYHSRACGRGNYSETTLSKAESRGLSPCSKCY